MNALNLTLTLRVPQTMPPSDPPIRSWRRRDVIKTLGATALTLPALLHASPAKAANAKVIKIGHVSPKTGPLAPFAEADPFILDQVRGVFAKGISNGGVTYAVEIISTDSQSKTNRASRTVSARTSEEKGPGGVAQSNLVWTW